MAAQQRHFWNLTEAASSRILVVDEFANDQQQRTMEAAVWHAWEHIPRPYFPDHAPAGTDHYAIEREAYRGPAANTSFHKPDVIVVRVRQPAPPVAPGQRPARAQERDVLWIECKAPSEIAPNGWHTVLVEAQGRLSSAHANPQTGSRQVYLILAVGMKWMCFLWNPHAALAQPLVVRKDNGRDFWTDIDPRIHPIPAATLPGQRHIVNGVIETNQAYTLNYWDVTAAGQLAHLADLTLLENLFAVIQAHNYTDGWNPPHF
ncbi:hypothetical protein QBC40DRAFT_286884 [Triangularia verruculosa]|uniref:Uncharacterized protein n=1 Tax=Triangularia verruculosa TaxID=2587418 RepID=A0AAN7AS99_9PEZI|nr:hypothetical protein QBC40DRAFT_286884 [Triangularia verruculosa]